MMRGEERMLINEENKEETVSMMKSMGKWTVKDLNIDGIQNVEPIWKEISRIHFTKLTSLALINSQLKSIEQLAELHTPHLRQLHLYKNEIRSSRIIRKAYWPSLAHFDLGQNWICDHQTLAEGYFPRITEIWAQFQPQKQSRFLNSSFALKFQSPEVRVFFVPTQKMAFERSLQGVIRKKWEDVMLAIEPFDLEL